MVLGVFFSFSLFRLIIIYGFNYDANGLTFCKYRILQYYVDLTVVVTLFECLPSEGMVR